jgi:hypothetical protein
LLEGRIQSSDPALAARTTPAHYEPYWGWLQAMQNLCFCTPGTGFFRWAS